VEGVLTHERIVLHELKLLLHAFLVLARPVADPLGLGALQFYKVILGHNSNLGGQTITHKALFCNHNGYKRDSA